MSEIDYADRCEAAVRILGGELPPGWSEQAATIDRLQAELQECQKQRVELSAEVAAVISERDRLQAELDALRPQPEPLMLAGHEVTCAGDVGLAFLWRGHTWYSIEILTIAESHGHNREEFAARLDALRAAG